MSFNRRVNELLKEKKMTKASLAKSSGIPYTTLDSMLKRDSETARLITIFRIADALGTSVEELVFDKKQKTGTVSSEEKRMLELYSLLDSRGRETALSLLEKEAEQSQKIRNSGKKNARRIPVFDSPAAAGVGLYIQNEDKMFEIHENVPEETTFGIRIKGDSMEPAIKDGEVLFVSENAEFSDGDIGIFVLNGESLCKKLSKIGGETYLLSINPKYKPIKILDTDEMKYVGKVLGKEDA